MVAGVADRFDVGAVRAVELPGAVVEVSDGEVLVVDEVVVGGADEREVGQVGGPAVAPVGLVVGVAPGGWPVASGEDASSVPDGPGDPLVAGGEPDLAAQVQTAAPGRRW